MSAENKKTDDVIDSDDDPVSGVFPEDYMIDQPEVPSIDDIDEPLLPILAHKDYRMLIYEFNFRHFFLLSICYLYL